MTESSSFDGYDEDEFEELAGPPVWVKVVAAVIAVVLLIVTVLVITGGPTQESGRAWPGLSASAA